MDLMYYLRSIGDDWRNPLRRVMAELYEIDGVEGGRPIARLLQRWNEAEDRFEAVEQPRRIGSGNDRLERNANVFRPRSM